MNAEPVTLHFLTWQGAHTLLAGVLVAAVAALVLLMLLGSEREKPIKPESWFSAAGWALLPVWVWLLGATLWGLWQVFNGVKDAPLASGSLGLGALIAAFLGAPFLVYGTYLRHKTQRLEQEGHMTDRITKAVEQLGAEKTVDRIGRPITIWTGTVKKTTYLVEDRKQFSLNPRSKVISERWDTTHLEHGGDEFEGLHISVKSWPNERTYIQWQGEDLEIHSDEEIGHVGDWKVFSESVANIEVRMGAILSLERIAQDSTIHDKGRDHVRVMEILCAYIRENSNARKPVEFPLAEWIPLKGDASEKERAEHLTTGIKRFGRYSFESVNRKWVQRLPKPRADVQLALTVIGRRGTEQRRVEAAWPDAPPRTEIWHFDPDFRRLPSGSSSEALNAQALYSFKDGLKTWNEKVESYHGYRLDLRGSNLQGYDMSANKPDGSDAVFSGVLIGDAKLDGAKLSRALFVGVRFSHNSLIAANMEETQLTGAHFARYCKLEGASLIGADLTDAYFSEAALDNAVFTRSTIDCITINDSSLEFGTMIAAKGRGVQLGDTSFFHSKFGIVDFSYSLFDGANHFLENLSRKSRLEYVAFRDLNICGVVVSRIGLNGFFGDASVILPAGVSRPDHWPVWDLPWQGAHAFDVEWRKWQTDPEGYRPPPKPE